MTDKPRPSASAMDCALTLATVAEWVRKHASAAVVNVEVTPGEWQPLLLIEAVELALTRFRAEHGDLE